MKPFHECNWRSFLPEAHSALCEDEVPWHAQRQAAGALIIRTREARKGPDCPLGTLKGTVCVQTVAIIAITRYAPKRKSLKTENLHFIVFIITFL